MSTMRKPLLYSAVVAVVLGAAFALLPDLEPQYQGRHLSDWLLSNTPRLGSRPGNPVSPEELDEAIRRIGKKGLPYLVRWMDFRPGKWRPRVFGCIPMVARKKLASRGSARFLRMIAWSEYQREFALKSGAWRALKMLGPEAAPALPDLAKVAARWPEKSATQMLEIMMAIGPAAVATMTNFVASLQTNEFKAEAIRELGGYVFNGALVIPALLEYLRHPVGEIAAESAGSLGCIGLQPELVVPALIEALDRPELPVRESAALALGDFGLSARVAVPKLKRLLAGTTGEAAAAVAALRKIAPGEFANLPTRPATD